MPHILNDWLDLIAKGAPIAFVLVSTIAALGSWWAARKQWLGFSTKVAETLRETESYIAEINRLKTDVGSIEDAEKRTEALQKLNEFATRYAKHKRFLESANQTLERRRRFFWPAMSKMTFLVGFTGDRYESASKRTFSRMSQLLLESLTNREQPVHEPNLGKEGSKAAGELK
jgi:hypothetical protein